MNLKFKIKTKNLLKNFIINYRQFYTYIVHRIESLEVNQITRQIDLKY